MVRMCLTIVLLLSLTIGWGQAALAQTATVRLAVQGMT